MAHLDETRFAVVIQGDIRSDGDARLTKRNFAGDGAAAEALIGVEPRVSPGAGIALNFSGLAECLAMNSRVGLGTCCGEQAAEKQGKCRFF